MIRILMLLGFLIGIGSIAIYFYKRIVVVRNIELVLRDIRDYNNRYPLSKNLEEIQNNLKKLLKELKK